MILLNSNHHHLPLAIRIPIRLDSHRPLVVLGIEKMALVVVIIQTISINTAARTTFRGTRILANDNRPPTSGSHILVKRVRRVHLVSFFVHAV